MPLPTTRRQLRDWALHKLGEPVIDVNISAVQCEERICEAIDYVQQNSTEMLEETRIAYQVKASLLYFDTHVLTPFQPGELIVGQTSGATAQFIDISSDNLIARVQNVTKENLFLPSEIVTGFTSGNTATLRATDPIVLGDIDNEFINMGDDIIGIIDIAPISAGSGYGNEPFNNFKYQFALEAFSHGLLSTDIVTYHMFRQHLALLDFELGSSKTFRFSQITNKLQIDAGWGEEIQVDDFLYFSVYTTINPSQYGAFYSSWPIYELVYLLFKLQWANNLKKYEEILLPGGVRINGQRMYEEVAGSGGELDRYYEKLDKVYSLPVGDIFMG